MESGIELLFNTVLMYNSSIPLGGVVIIKNIEERFGLFKKKVKWRSQVGILDSVAPDAGSFCASFCTPLNSGLSDSLDS